MTDTKYTLYIAFGIEGLEAVIDMTAEVERDKKYLFDKLKNPDAERPIGVNLEVLRMRWILNSHRHIEAWGIVATLSPDEIRGAFDDHPELMKNLIREKGVKLF